jgi:hypothetical protein
MLHLDGLRIPDWAGRKRRADRPNAAIGMRRRDALLMGVKFLAALS